MPELLLRNTNEKDVDAVVLMEADIENSNFIFPNTKEEHFKLIGDPNIEHLLLKDISNTLIGFVILAGVLNQNKSIEFRRIVIDKKGKGYGRRAIIEMKKYCFEELHCHRLWLDVLETNERARHLYLSEGFIEEGKLRDCILKGDEYISLIIMSILADEYGKTS